jgi:hypothetical protein
MGSYFLLTTVKILCTVACFNVQLSVSRSYLFVYTCTLYSVSADS